MLKPIAEHGVFSFLPIEYGKSVLGAPLQYFPGKENSNWLVMAGVHGEEAEGVFLLSRILRSLKAPLASASVILSVNPDGLSQGTRGNARGVDLNRNFPTKNWKNGVNLSRPWIEAKPEIELSSGAYPASEPETSYLVQLIENLKPKGILSIHAPLACIDCPEKSKTVEDLEKVFSLPWVEDVGYPTPGSFGSWCKEKAIPCITLELPRMPAEVIARDYQIPFTEFLMNL